MTYILIQNCCDGFWAWPWPLILAFLLGLLLGWFLSKILGPNENDSRKKIDSLQAELDACRSNAKIIQSTPVNTKSSFIATSIAADDSVKDNLTKVEGIGPKIKGLLNDDGIWSFAQLSESSIERLQNILDKAGPRYRVHKPKTWAKQAAMAAKGDWDKLKKWQNELKGGV